MRFPNRPDVCFARSGRIRLPTRDACASRRLPAQLTTNKAVALGGLLRVDNQVNGSHHADATRRLGERSARNSRWSRPRPARAAVRRTARARCDVAASLRSALFAARMLCPTFSDLTLSLFFLGRRFGAIALLRRTGSSPTILVTSSSAVCRRIPLPSRRAHRTRSNTQYLENCDVILVTDIACE